jgi:hypothetical protein
MTVSIVHTILQRNEAGASCVKDRTAPVCVCIMADSSRHLQEQQCVLQKCRRKLLDLKIPSGPDLKNFISEKEEFQAKEPLALFELFFELSAEESEALSARLLCNTVSDLITLQGAINVFFESSSETTIADDDDDSDGWDDDAGPFTRMQSNDPILLRNRAAISALGLPQSGGGHATHSLPEYTHSADSDEVGSFHPGLATFSRKEVEIDKEPPFGIPIQDEDDGNSDDVAR